jgi:hypothetical protein
MDRKESLARTLESGLGCCAPLQMNGRRPSISFYRRDKSNELDGSGELRLC